MRWSAIGAVLATLALAACGAGSAPHGHNGAATSRVRQLPCHEFIDAQPPLGPGRVVLGVVLLPASPPVRRALQTARVASHDPKAGLFAKWGLVIRAGARLRLIVPPRLASRVSIGWGNANEGHRGTTIVVGGCTGPRGARWLAYAGGYYVRHPICAPLIVVAHRQRRRVRIGVGKACPGQRPPPEPTSG